MKNPPTTRLASALIVGQNPINEDIDGGLHPAVDGQSLYEDRACSVVLLVHVM